MSGLSPVLDYDAEAPGIVGHDAVDPGSDYGTEVALVVNRPDNKAQARPRWARGVDRIAPPEFLDEKRPPRLDRHGRLPLQGKARAYLLIAVDNRWPGAHLDKLGPFGIEGHFHGGMGGLVPALGFIMEVVKDRLIRREEHSFVQCVNVLQGRRRAPCSRPSVADEDGRKGATLPWGMERAVL